MTWVRIDDAALSHPKIARAGVDGFALWMGSLAYANRHVTDGFIPSDCLSLLVPSSWKLGDARLSLIAARLVTLALWHSADSGWLIHDYADYQEQALKVNVTDRRERDAERKRQQRTREKRRGSDGSHAVTPCDSHTDDVTRVTRAVTRGVTERVRETSADSRPPLSQPPVPSRPVPSRPTVANATDARASMTADQARAALEDEWRKSGKPVDSGLQILASKSPVFALVELYPDEAQLRSVAAAFLKDDDDWLVKSRHPLAWLAKNSTRYVETKGPTVRANSTYQNRTMTGAELFATGGQ